jgi:excisionase family DNA binding protein
MDDKFLTCREVESILKISKSKLYRMIHANELPVTRIGSTYRIRASELETYLTKNHTTSENKEKII